MKAKSEASKIYAQAILDLPTTRIASTTKTWTIDEDIGQAISKLRQQIAKPKS